MSGFEFQKKVSLSICGREFELSALDRGYLDGLLRLYAQIMSLQGQYERAQALLLCDAPKAEQVQRAGQEILEANGLLLLSARQFLQTALGENGYWEIFQNRPVNTREHLQLCTYLFEQLLEEGAEDAGEDSLEDVYDAWAQ